MIKSITPFLWFNNEAEEAAHFYVSLFPDSSVQSSGPIITNFTLCGLALMALNGGPNYKFTPAFSLFVSVETQAEVDQLWDALLADGGKPSRCGWLKDKYGLSWQIIPALLGELMGDQDEKKSAAVFAAMMQMIKIDVAELRRAYDEA